MPTRSQLARVLNPTDTEHPNQTPTTAAVSVVARDKPTQHGDRSLEILFIQRASSPRDPWSGQMAFPGGRYEPPDMSLTQTARRETLEEVGLDLFSIDPLGTLNELDGGRATNRLVSVRPVVFWLGSQSPKLKANYEVADIVWVPVSDLLDPNRHIQYHYPPAGTHFPGIQLNQANQVIWGLTLRMLSDLFNRLEYDFITL